MYKNEEEVTNEDLESVNTEIPNILKQDIDFFTQPVLMEEVSNCVWELHLEKAPGPYGFTISFYMCC